MTFWLEFLIGNIGWILVRHPDVVAPLIDIPKEVIEGLGNFLIAISCGWVMNPKKFGEFCKTVDKLMIDAIGWHPSVPSIHLGWNYLQAKLLNEFSFYLVVSLSKN